MTKMRDDVKEVDKKAIQWGNVESDLEIGLFFSEMDDVPYLIYAPFSRSEMLEWLNDKDTLLPPWCILQDYRAGWEDSCFLVGSVPENYIAPPLTEWEEKQEYKRNWG